MTEILTQTVDLSHLCAQRGGSHTLSGVVARPAGEGPWPGVVVVMEIFGVEQNMRARAERIAGWGYLVVVANLCSDGGARRCLVATMRSLITGRGKAMTGIETSRQWLVDQPETTGSTGIIGFCRTGGGPEAGGHAPGGFRGARRPGAPDVGPRLPQRLDSGALRAGAPVARGRIRWPRADAEDAWQRIEDCFAAHLAASA